MNDPTFMNCPRCNLGLMEQPAKAKGVHVCPGCAGLWLTEAVVARRLGEKAQRRLSDTRYLWASQLKCPEDRHVLQEVQLSKVTVDTCSQCHGLWLDGGELERILASRVKGGSLNLGAKGEGSIWAEVLGGFGDVLPEVFDVVVSVIIEAVTDSL